MKNKIQWNLIPSLLVIGGCLALSQVAQAQPAFHGTLTIRLDGEITASDMMEMMGSTMTMPSTLGEANMLTIPATGEVGQGTGDFTKLKITHGDTVAFSTTMWMPGTSGGISFGGDSGLMITIYNEMFISEGKHDLHINSPVSVMDMTSPDFGIANGELNGYFVSNAKGVISGYFTIDIPVEQ